MDIRKAYATDKTKEIEGVWSDIGEDAKLRIARFGNPVFQKELARIRKPYKQQIARGTLAEGLSTSLLIQAMAKTILLDWEGIEADGKPLPYSYENAVMLLTELKDFRDLVSELSMQLELFKIEADEGIEGN